MENQNLKKIDGLDALCSLFENEDALVEHIVEHTLFFDREMVRDQARDLRALIRTGQNNKADSQNGSGLIVGRCFAANGGDAHVNSFQFSANDDAGGDIAAH